MVVLILINPFRAMSSVIVYTKQDEYKINSRFILEAGISIWTSNSSALYFSEFIHAHAISFINHKICWNLGRPISQTGPNPKHSCLPCTRSNHIVTGVRANNRWTKAVEPKLSLKCLSEVVPKYPLKPRKQSSTDIHLSLVSRVQRMVFTIRWIH